VSAARKSVALVAITLATAGCLPASATTEGHAVSDLWTIFLIAAAIVGGLVWGLITLSIIRYRRRKSDTSSGEAAQTVASHALPLEIAWTTGPILIVLFLFVMTLFALQRIDAREAGGINVQVDAFRWQWRFTYPDAGVTVTGTRDVIAEMVVPVGEPVHITLTSDDVDHSFYVPVFLFKRDAIPGHPTQFDFTVDQPGSYGGQCAEFCGVYHDRMLLTVRAVTRPEYEAWLTSQAGAAGSPGASGPASASPAPGATATPVGSASAGASGVPGSSAAPSGSATTSGATTP
jgi:cytochrome c oxidase subunit 2